jgi:hypothetical protein
MFSKTWSEEPVMRTGRLITSTRPMAARSDTRRSRRFPHSGTDSSQTLPQSRANSSLKLENSLLAGKIQGILFVGAFECEYWLGIQGQIQRLTT